MADAAPLTPQARGMLAEFDALLESYIGAGIEDATEHPLHDSLGVLAVKVAEPTPDTAIARRDARSITLQDHRMPAWLNPDGTYSP